MGLTGHHSRTGADAQQLLIAAPPAEPANEHAHVCSLASRVCVELIQHQKLQIGELAVDEPPLVGSGHHQLQHHVVGQEYMRWMLLHLLPFVLLLLTGIDSEANRAAIPEVLQQSIERLLLRVHQGIHGIHYHRPHLLRAGMRP